MAEISYGGQAVVEGVMIRSPRYVGVACRLPTPDGGFGETTPIDVHTEAVRSLFTRHPWIRKVPLVRGAFALVEMLSMGMRALERSANIQATVDTVGASATSLLSLVHTLLLLPLTALLALADESPPATPTAPNATDGGDGKGALTGPILWTTVAISLSVGVALFVLLPNYLAKLIGDWLGGEQAPAQLYVIIEHAVQFVLFIAYVGLIGLMTGIRRVFMYHGAEHKVVNGFEHGVPLTPDGVATQSVIHPRCGTNFAFLTIFVGMVAYTFIDGWLFPEGWGPLWQRLLVRLVCLPLIAGLSFEVIRFVGAHRDSSLLQLLIWPGLMLQRLTTRPPDKPMLEVALASFTAVKRAEETDELTVGQFASPQAQPEHGLLGELA